MCSPGSRPLHAHRVGSEGNGFHTSAGGHDVRDVVAGQVGAGQGLIERLFGSFLKVKPALGHALREDFRLAVLQDHHFGVFGSYVYSCNCHV